MSAPMSPDEISRSLMAMGVPREKADRAAVFVSPTANLQAVAEHLAPPLSFPVRIVLPWSALCSDNDRYGAIIRGTMESPFPKLIITANYREAKAKAKRAGLDAMNGNTPLKQRLALIARVYVPDERPHDVCNFAKCAHDALEKAVYSTDAWLYDVRWIRAGVDVDAPRAEIEISPC